MVHYAFVDCAILAGRGTEVVEQPGPTAGESDEELGLRHRLHHPLDQLNGNSPIFMPVSRLIEAVAVLSRYVDAVYTHTHVDAVYTHTCG